MHVAIAQMNSNPGAFGTIFDRMKTQADSAQSRGCDVICFPLPLLMGTKLGMLGESEEFMTDLLEGLEDFARDCPIAALVPVQLDTRIGLLRDVMLVQDGCYYPLSITQSISSLGQKSARSTADVVFDLKGMRCRLVFEYNQLQIFDESPDTSYDNPQITFFFPSEPFSADQEHTLLAPSISANCFDEEVRTPGSWLVAVGGVGGYEEDVFPGGSFIMAPWGELAAVAPSFEESFISFEISPNFEGPLSDPISAPSYDRFRHVWEALALGLHDFIEKSGLTGVLVPVTGDLTSTCVLVLAVDALGPTKVHAAVLPRHDFNGAEEYCRQLVTNLRVGFEDPLSSEPGEHSIALSERMEESLWHIDRAISRRLHTDLSNVMLAHNARKLDVCVLGVSDKTSIAMQWNMQACSAAIFEPLGDVYRTDVCALARFRNTISPVIPDYLMSLYDLPQGLELEKVGTSTEAQLSELDAILYLHIENAKGISHITSEGFDERLVAAVANRLRQTAVWRSRVPMAPAISDCPLTLHDWPVVLGWKDRLRNPFEDKITSLLKTVSSHTIEKAFEGEDPEDTDEDTDSYEYILGMLADILMNQNSSYQMPFGGHAENETIFPTDEPLAELPIWDRGLFSQN